MSCCMENLVLNTSPLQQWLPMVIDERGMPHSSTRSVGKQIIAI